MTVTQREISLPSRPRGFHIITREIEHGVPEISGYGIGTAHIMILHTSAGLAINENADPDVRTDFETIFDTLVPEGDPRYVHTMEGRDDMPAHVKSSLVGHDLTLPVRDGRLVLGTWQGIYLCEFRNHGGTRRLVVTITGEMI